MMPSTSVAARSAVVVRLVSFLRFAGLSGLGWLMDVTILLLLVGALGVPAFAANVVSSSTAALCVFLLSRRLVFERKAHALGTRVAIYMAYTLCMILVAAAVLQAIASFLGGLEVLRPLHLSATVLAGIAKVIVTPPQLLLNFFMARAMSERTIGTPSPSCQTRS